MESGITFAWLIGTATTVIGCIFIAYIRIQMDIVKLKVRVDEMEIKIINNKEDNKEDMNKIDENVKSIFKAINEINIKIASK